MKKVFNLTISVFLILAGACYAQEISYGGNWTMTCKGKASNYFGVVSYVDFSHKILIHDWEATSNLDLSLSQTDPVGYQGTGYIFGAPVGAHFRYEYMDMYYVEGYVKVKKNSMKATVAFVLLYTEEGFGFGTCRLKRDR